MISEKLKINVDNKKKIITFKSKNCGNFKFNFKERDLLLSLLGVPLTELEIDEFMPLSVDEKKKYFKFLLKKGLVESVATIHKKRKRGDEHLNIFWRLTDKGEKVARYILEYLTNEKISI
ncbi:MAG: hypothetical protein ACTSQP_14515 [Promethearchaeota archaeon]